MGLWTDYTKKDTPEDNDTLMLYDAAGKANKQILFSGFWKWVANKLKEATLSDLQTTDKTMIGAINELNSKPLVKHGFIDGIECPANTITTVSLTYDKPFPRYPTVVCCLRSGTTMADYGSLTVFVDYANSEKTGCNLKIANNSKYDLKPAINWIAVSNQ